MASCASVAGIRRNLFSDFAAEATNFIWEDLEENVKEDLTFAFKYRNTHSALRIINTKIPNMGMRALRLRRWAFLSACAAGDSEVVSHLLAKGENSDVQFGDRIAPLTAAVNSNNFETVQELIKNGAKVECRSKSGDDSTLNQALIRGLIPTRNVGFEMWEKTSMTDVRIINLLIDSDADVNASCTAGYLPLSLAVSSNRYNLARHLINKGANVNGVDQRGKMTPIMHAAASGDFRFARLLTSSGAKIDVTNSVDNSPLRLASQYNNVVLLTHLLRHGADPNTVSAFDKKSALIIAVENHCTDNVKVLLAYGANPAYTHPDVHGGSTAYDTATKLGCSDIAAILCEKTSTN